MIFPTLFGRENKRAETLKDENEIKKKVQRENKRQKESDLENKKRKENKIEKNLEEINKLLIDIENFNDKIDKLKNNYETVDNIVNKNIQTIKDFESNFVKEKILNFIKNNGDKLRFKLYLIKEAEKRIKESGKNEGIGGSYPLTHLDRYNKDNNNKPTPYSTKHYNPQNIEHEDKIKGNEPSSNNKNNYDVEQDKNDLNEYKNDYFTIMLKIKKDIIYPSIIENEIERIKNENEKIKDDINKIDKNII